MRVSTSGLPLHVETGQNRGHDSNHAFAAFIHAQVNECNRDFSPTVLGRPYNWAGGTPAVGISVQIMFVILVVIGSLVMLAALIWAG
jgi:hypothetical protein